MEGFWILSYTEGFHRDFKGKNDLDKNYYCQMRWLDNIYNILKDVFRLHEDKLFYHHYVSSPVVWHTFNAQKPKERKKERKRFKWMNQLMFK